MTILSLFAHPYTSFILLDTTDNSTLKKLWCEAQSNTVLKLNIKYFL